MKPNRYDNSFKAECVKLALSGELSYVQITRDLGVNYKTLCNWIGQTMKNSSLLNHQGTSSTEKRYATVKEIDKLLSMHKNEE